MKNLLTSLHQTYHEHFRAYVKQTDWLQCFKKPKKCPYFNQDVFFFCNIKEVTVALPDLIGWWFGGEGTDLGLIGLIDKIVVCQCVTISCLRSEEVWFLLVNLILPYLHNMVILDWLTTVIIKVSVNLNLFITLKFSWQWFIFS